MQITKTITEDFGSSWQLTITFTVTFTYEMKYHGKLDGLPYYIPAQLNVDRVEIDHVYSINPDGSIAYSKREMDPDWYWDFVWYLSEWVEEHLDRFYEELQ